MNDIFQRTQLLVGPEAMERLAKSRVIVFGVGGVGSWCAESLVRSGIRQLTIVDADCVAESNINRQLLATTLTVGQPKVEVMRQRLLTINPDAEITALQQVFTETTAQQFPLQDYDYVIDAIDSVDDKLLLIHRATAAIDEATGKRPTLLSSMGAGRKTDVSQIRVGEFSKGEGCPLARSLRRKIRDSVMNGHSLAPQRKFQCVWSPEISAESGTIAPIVGVFGMTLANLVIQDIL